MSGLLARYLETFLLIRKIDSLPSVPIQKAEFLPLISLHLAYENLSEKNWLSPLFVKFCFEFDGNNLWLKVFEGCGLGWYPMYDAQVSFIFYSFFSPAFCFIPAWYSPYISDLQFFALLLLMTLCVLQTAGWLRDLLGQCPPKLFIGQDRRWPCNVSVSWQNAHCNAEYQGNALLFLLKDSIPNLLRMKVS